MQVYWILVLLLLMGAVGMSLDPAEVLARWRKLPAGYWLKIVVAAFLIPPLCAILMAAFLPLTFEVKRGLLLLSVAPGAPMLTRMVSRKGKLFDAHIAASYQIMVGLLVPVMTPVLVELIGRYYHKDVHIGAWTLLRQVAVMQFLPLTLGLLVRHHHPGFAAKAEPWMSRIGNAMLVGYLLVVAFSLGKVLAAVGAAAAGAAFLFSLSCLVSGHLLANPTVALSNANRHVGLAMLVAGLNLRDGVKAVVPFLLAYVVLAPLSMAVYAARQRQRSPATLPI